VVPDAQVGRTYTWHVCLVVKPYVSRQEVLKELREYFTAGPRGVTGGVSAGQ